MKKYYGLAVKILVFKEHHTPKKYGWFLTVKIRDKVSFEFSQTLSQPNSLPDPIAMAVAIDKSVITYSKKVFVSILLNDDYSRGQTAIDYIGVTNNKPNAEVVLAADTDKFMKMLFLSLK